MQRTLQIKNSTHCSILSGRIAGTSSTPFNRIIMERKQLQYYSEIIHDEKIGAFECTLLPAVVIECSTTSCCTNTWNQQTSMYTTSYINNVEISVYVTMKCARCVFMNNVAPCTICHLDFGERLTQEPSHHLQLLPLLLQLELQLHVLQVVLHSLVQSGETLLENGRMHAQTRRRRR